MRFQIATFDAASECWYFYRENTKVVTFISITTAEDRAREMSERNGGAQVLVITCHCGFKTEITYPKPEPIKSTTRFTFPYGDQV